MNIFGLDINIKKMPNISPPDVLLYQCSTSVGVERVFFTNWVPDELLKYVICGWRLKSIKKEIKISEQYKERIKLVSENSGIKYYIL